MEIHLDPLGGLSGDMFAAAMLDAFPEHWAEVERAVAALDLGPGADCRLIAHRDRAGLTGRRFIVAESLPSPLWRGVEGEGPGREAGGRVTSGVAPPAEPSAPTSLDRRERKSASVATGEKTHGLQHGRDDARHRSHDHHDDDHPHEHVSHGHRRWRDIREMLAGPRLPVAARDHAIGIFELLAAAEAEVHGVEEADVTFHEVGAVDSIVDIVAAGLILALVGASAWSASPLPLGSGRIRTQHGLLPVPAPATALLLRGLATLDDGVPGERVTPTGAAIARYLLTSEAPARSPRRLLRSGTGFGSRELPGLSNCLRVLVFEPVTTRGQATSADFTHRELGVITFEVDDLSAEDLANGLDHIRAMPGIHDVIQSVAFGKKGRVATQVQVLAAPDALDAAIRACFTETTTIGLRFHTVRGAALRRLAEDVDVEGRAVRVKLVERPGGLVTAKAEASDVAADPGHAVRALLRHAAEVTAVLRDGHRFGRRPAGETS